MALTTAFISVVAMHSTAANADNGWSSEGGNGSSWHGHQGVEGYTSYILVHGRKELPYTICKYFYYKTYSNQVFGSPIYIISYSPLATSCPPVIDLTN